MYRKGYNGTGVKEIVEAAGIPKGSFYNYFDSKEDFAVEALKFKAERHLARVKERLTDRSLPPLERIERFFADYLAWVTDSGQYCSGCFIGNLCQEMADHNEAICREVNRQIKAHESLIADCLREAGANGDLRTERDPEVLAGFIFASWEGAVLRMKACRSEAPLEAFQQVLAKDLLGL